MVTAALNVVLDYIFIFPLEWGVRGAAFATSLSLVAGGVMALVYLFFFAEKLRPAPLKLSATSLKLSLRNIGYQCRIGSSALLGEATMAVLMFVGNHVFMHYLGDDGVGAFGIACYYMPFVFMIGNAIAQSAQPIVSYNYGLGSLDRVQDTLKVSLSVAAVFGAVLMVVFMSVPDALVGLFVSKDTPAAHIAVEGFPYLASGFIFFVVNLAVVGYFQSVERVLPATVFALLRGFIFLVPSFLILPDILGTGGIWLALLLSETLTAMTILSFYIITRHRSMCRP